MVPSRVLPDFLIIGAAKAATTRVTYSLTEHPNVFIPRTEIHYFSRHFDEFTHSLDWYENHFAAAGAASLIGENSNTYLYYPGVPRRLATVLPDTTKLIAILRNPVNRAYSGYCMQFRRGHVTRDIRRYLDPDVAEAAAKFHFLEQGLYHRHLVRYLRYFPVECLNVMLLDDLKADSEAFVEQLLTFLDLDADFFPESIDRPLNTKRAASIPTWVRTVARMPVLKDLLSFAQGQLPKYKEFLPSQRMAYPKMSDSLRERLIAYYEQDVRRLSLLLHRDLSHWLG